ncbi:MAG: HAD-IA family hydrolase [Candidatus Binatia bacterium]
MPGDLVIFDFDGTLADTVGDITTGLNRVLDEAGLPPAGEVQVRAWVGHGVRRLIGQAIGSDEPGRVEALAARFRVHYEACCLDTTALYDGMNAALAALAERHTLAVLSNKPQRFLDRIAEGLAIRPRFAAVVGGDALAVSKPDPAAIAHVVARIGGAAARVWMVGDSAVDVETGRRYGARTVGCAWGLRGPGELRAAGAEVIVEHPSALPAVIA